MNKLSIESRAQIIGALVEGNSLRSTSRMTGAAINTVMKLLVDAGSACAAYQDTTLRNLNCRRLQLDEIWSFVGVKELNKPESEHGKFGRGDVWTWTAIDADSKLIPCWLVSTRDAGAASEFISDLRSRVRGRVQVTTDGHSAYLSAIEDSFGAEVDYAQLVKIYGADPQSERRYSPAVCIGARAESVKGKPDPKHISTSYAERANLTMRMGMRRFTRLTNGFSKKVENHAHAVALHFMHYNFARQHSTLRVSPAMAAGVTKHLWSIEEIAALVP
jgi:IS1 family transposase